MAPLDQPLSHAPSPPCTHHPNAWQSQSQLGSAVARGAVPGFAYLPSYSGSCCTQASSPDQTSESPTSTTSNLQTACLTQRLRPLLGSAWPSTMLLCLVQLLTGVVGVIVTSPGSYLSFHLVFVNTPYCVQGSPRSELCFCPGKQLQDQASCRSGAAPTSVAELLCGSRSKPSPPARPSRLLQVMVEIISGVPLEIILCS